MLKYIDETEYETLLGVESIPENFQNLVIRASAIIDKKTYGRIDFTNMDSDLIEKVKYTTCLVVNLLSEKETYISNNFLTSTNIEGWSESYRSGSEVSLEVNNAIDDILYDFLAGSGLLKSRNVVLYE